MTASMLSHDHAEVDRLLEEALSRSASTDSAEAFRAIDLFWARLAMHIRAEHLHFFPAVLDVARREGIADIPEILDRLRRDHDFFMHQLAELIKEMRGAAVNAQPVLHSIRERLIEHNSIEEDRVYSLQQFFSQEESQNLSQAVAKELNNLPPRFRD